MTTYLIFYLDNNDCIRAKQKYMTDLSVKTKKRNGKNM